MSLEIFKNCYIILFVTTFNIEVFLKYQKVSLVYIPDQKFLLNAFPPNIQITRLFGDNISMFEKKMKFNFMLDTGWESKVTRA